MKSKILIVDDDPEVIAFYEDYLERGYAPATALSGAEGLKLVQTRGPFAVVVADMNMPEMNGIEFLEKCARLAPDTVRIMLTGEADLRSAIEAINKGHLFQFLTKPCPPELFARAVENGVKQYKLVTAERELLEKTLSGAINMLTEILSHVEAQSFGQSQRVREYTRTLTEALQLDELWELEAAAMLCQIGYVTIPASIMQKVCQGLTLETNEKRLLEQIPEIGSKILAHIPRLETVAKIVYYHNKSFDGSGFPYDGVAGEKIPIGSRILKIVTDLVRLEAEGLSRSMCLEHMSGFPGRYDPTILTTAMTVLLKQAPDLSRKRGKPVSLKELAVGQTVVENIETLDRVKVVGAGAKISPMLLEKLYNFDQLGNLKEPFFVDD